MTMSNMGAGDMSGTVWRVWCPDEGAGKDDGRNVVATSAEYAAVLWAEWRDSSSNDYTIVRGTSLDVLVAEDEDGAPEHRFTVSGEPSAIYYARATPTGSR